MLKFNEWYDEGNSYTTDLIKYTQPSGKYSSLNFHVRYVYFWGDGVLRVIRVLLKQLFNAEFYILSGSCKKKREKNEISASTLVGTNIFSRFIR